MCSRGHQDEHEDAPTPRMEGVPACAVEALAAAVSGPNYLGIPSAHIFGLSLGAAVGMHLAASYPDKVKSLSLHSAWPQTDAFIRAVVQSWQTSAKALGSVSEMVIQSIFPWCFTPELYANRPEYIESLAAFVRSRPAQPLSAFIQSSDAVIEHDAVPKLSRITAPTLITFGLRDVVTSTRFAGPMTGAIGGSELLIFETCSHAPIYEQVEEFNQRTLSFLLRHALSGSERKQV